MFPPFLMLDNINELLDDVGNIRVVIVNNPHAFSSFLILTLENIPDKNDDVDDDVLSVKNRLVHVHDITPFLVLS